MRLLLGLAIGMTVFGSVSVSADFPIEPVLLPNAVLLVDKANGRNWILEIDSARQPGSELAWKELPLPGAGFPGQPVRGQMSTRFPPARQQHPGQGPGQHPGQHPGQGPGQGPGMAQPTGQGGPVPHPAMMSPPELHSYGPIYPPNGMPGPQWQAPQPSQYPAGSYSQAVPPYHMGAMFHPVLPTSAPPAIQHHPFNHQENLAPRPTHDGRPPHLEDIYGHKESALNSTDDGEEGEDEDMDDEDGDDDEDMDDDEDEDMERSHEKAQPSKHGDKPKQKQKRPQGKKK